MSTTPMPLDRLRSDLTAAVASAADALAATDARDLPADSLRRQIAHARSRLARAVHHLDHHIEQERAS